MLVLMAVGATLAVHWRQQLRNPKVKGTLILRTAAASTVAEYGRLLECVRARRYTTPASSRTVELGTRLAVANC